jgi:hypothetical protein
VALVSTLVPQRRLPGVDKEAVPGQEVASEMDRVRLVDVHGNEIVKVVLCRRKVGLLGRLVPDALDCADVILLLVLRQSVPEIRRVSNIFSSLSDELHTSRDESRRWQDCNQAAGVAAAADAAA